MRNAQVPTQARRSAFGRMGLAKLRGLLGSIPMLALVVLLFLLPFAMLFVGAFRTAAPGLPGSWSLSPFIAAYSNAQTWVTFGNSLIYSVADKAIILVVALALVTISTRTDAVLGRFLTPVMVLVFAMPGLFFAISWSMLANPNVGLINRWLQDLLAGHAPTLTATSWYGLIIVTALKGVAVEYLLLLGPFMTMDRSLEEAAQVAGSSRLRTILTIDIPTLAPAITSVAIIGFVVVMGSLDIPLILGVPDHIYVLSSQIYSFIASHTPAEYGSASALSLLLAVILFALVISQRRLLRGKSFETITGKGHRREPWHVSGFTAVAISVFIIVYALLALLLPVMQLVLGSFEPFFGTMSHLTTNNYVQLFSTPGIYGTIVNSIIIGVVGGFLAMAISVLFAYRRAHNSRVSTAISLLTWIPFGIPGIVLSIGLIWAYLSVPGLKDLYATVWIVLIGLIVIAIPLTSRVAEAAFAQVSRSLEEAARMSGATKLRALWGVLLRVVAPSLGVGWVVAGILIIGNLDVPVLLSSPTNQTLSVMVFNLYEQGDTSEAAALFCVLLAIILAALLLCAAPSLVMRILRKRRTALAVRSVAVPVPEDGSVPERISMTLAHQGTSRGTGEGNNL